MDQPNQPSPPSPGNTPANSEEVSPVVTSQDSFKYDQLTPENQTQLDFILIRQKDKISSLIDSGSHSEAYHALRVVKELWIATNYEYKFNELSQRITRRSRSRSQR